MVSQFEGAPPENIRLPWKNLAVTNTLAYFQSVGEKKSFYNEWKRKRDFIQIYEVYEEEKNKIIYHLGLFIHL